MTQITVKDASGNPVTIEAPPAPGRAAAAAAVPVVLATEDKLALDRVGPASNIATAQAAVGNTATQIVAARDGRHFVTITNLSTVPIFYGTSGVSPSNGALLPGIIGASLTLPVMSAVYGITQSGTANVSVTETY